ncbi:MAG: Crp/Fnr family transcriptional regulator [Helicobacteraceae bacterium]|nr:Crp/Fnr family transcriptional regulator [Helicobacteraceae bacterium]
MVFKKCNMYCDMDLKNIISEMEDFKNINKDTFQSILDISHFKEYSKNSIIYYADDDVQYIYYLFHGAIKSYKINKFNNEVIMNLHVNNCVKADSPPLINYHALITNKSSNNLYCLENCKLLSINAKEFNELLRLDINLANNFLSRANKIISEQEYIINLSLAMDSKDKILSLLERNPDIFINFSKKLISQMLNISQETLSRTLHKLPDIYNKPKF